MWTHCTSRKSLQNMFTQLFQVHERQKPRLMCVDTLNRYITKEWFKKTLKQHCTVCRENIVWKIDLQSHIEKNHGSFFHYEEFEVDNVKESMLAFITELIFSFMRGKNPSLMCVDKLNVCITKEWFKKTLKQHCIVCA